MVLKVGIAGYGVVGRRRREYIDLHPDLTTVAVCDTYFEGDGILDDGLRRYAVPADMITNEDLDVLFVCLPNDVAPEVTIMGLEADLHVFCEKPPGRDLTDLAEVMACEKRHPALKLMYGFNHRYHLAVREALQIIASGDLGRVINLRGVYGKSKIISFQSTWRTQRAIAGGGILLDQGIHMVDLMRLLVGEEFRDINSFVSNAYWRHDVEDNAYALMRTDSGVVAFLHSSATEWRHRFHLEITLEKGALRLSGILSGSKSYGAETLTVVKRGDDDGGDPYEQTTRYNEDPSWADEISAFHNMIDNDLPVERGSSEEAWKTMELVYKIYCADPDWRDRYGLRCQVDGDRL